MAPVLLRTIVLKLALDLKNRWLNYKVSRRLSSLLRLVANSQLFPSLPINSRGAIINCKPARGRRKICNGVTIIAFSHLSILIFQSLCLF